MKTIGVLLGGSGHRDGSEIHEAVFTLLALESQGFQLRCLAPNQPQKVQVNHHTGQAQTPSRNLLVEAARIARGKIAPLDTVDASSLDGLVIPGGFGAAQNFCDFATQGQNMQVDPEIAALIRDVHTQKKPLGAICISPVILGRVLGSHGITLTLGDDPQGEAILKAWGVKPQKCLPGECLVDETHRIVSTPAYMYGESSISLVSKGIHRLAEEINRLSCLPF